MVPPFEKGSKVTKDSEPRSFIIQQPKLIKLIFSFFSISLLLFGGTALMIGYSQTQQSPTQSNQQTPQQEEKLDLQNELQLLQRVQQASELGEEEENAENATGATENGTDVFSYATEVPSLRDLRKIQIETKPGSTLREKAMGSSILGTPFEVAIGNSTSNGNLTSLENATSFANMTSLTNFTPVGNLTATVNALNPTTTEPVSDKAGTWSGCETGYLARVHPEWVPVKPTKESQPWMEPVTAEGTMTHSPILVNYIEFPFSHHSHDRTFHFDPDPAYANLDSTRPGNIETEWEIGYTNTGITDRFPKEFWPWEGDRVWMMGWWVIDCGHYKVRDLGTEDNPILEAYDYKTEIHPPFITAFTRNELYQFPGEANPSSAVVTYIYLHGRGGTHDTSVGGQNYEFDVKLNCLGPAAVCAHHELRYNVISLPFGGPQPVLTKSGANKAHVVIPLSNIPASPDLRYGAIVASKTVNPDAVIQSTQSSRSLRVTFDSINIYKDHDWGSAEWKNLWVGVNGKWIELSGPLGHYGLTDADDGETFAFPDGNKTVTVTVPENGELKITTTGWESDQDSCYLPPSLFNCDATTLAHINAPIGYINQVYTCSQNLGVPLGPPLEHSSLSLSTGDDETEADFSLNYHVEQLSRTAGTVGGCTGPPPVIIPKVDNEPIDLATAKILDAGLYPQIICPTDHCGEDVSGTEPRGGEIVGKGSIVKMFSRGPVIPP